MIPFSPPDKAVYIFGTWSKTNLYMGFLSLSLTAIISFKGACKELAEDFVKEDSPAGIPMAKSRERNG